MSDLRKKLAMLDELEDYLDTEGGESMKGMSMDGEEDEPPMPGEEDPAAVVVAVGKPEEGPPKPHAPPPPGGGGGDIMAFVQKALNSSDPAVKAAAEAFMKKGG